MPTYNDLRPDSDFEERDYERVFPDMSAGERERAIGNILPLRTALDEHIPDKRADRSILVASWNIKEFGHTSQRLSESYYYIAEIIARFDLVAIQEVKSTLKDLNIVMRLLGDDWSYVINDITEGTHGNSERSAYLYNNKRVKFGGLAGEIVLWDDLTVGSGMKQLKRTPFMTGFESGWKKFAMVNLHLQPGDSTDDLAKRRAEVEHLLAALKKKIKGKRLWNDNVILVGDFNLYDGDEKDDPTIALINAAGYIENEGLKGKRTNVAKTSVEAFDRMFVTKSRNYFTFGIDDQGAPRAGVFNYFEHVFKDGDEQDYKAEMKDVYGGDKSKLDNPAKLKSYYSVYWRKNQLSDHLPIWFELIIDSSDKFLAEKLEEFE